MKFLSLMVGFGALAGTALGRPDGTGLVVLDRSADGALRLVGNSRVEIPARAVYVNSSSGSAVDTSGSAVLDTPNLYLVGDAQLGGGSYCTGTIHRSANPYADPFAGVRIPNGQDMTNRGAMSISGGSRTLQPGYYPSGVSISGNAEVSMAPGVYVIHGNFRVSSGSLSGQGVAVVMLDGSMDIRGQGLQLSPPITGDLVGLVIAQPSSNSNEMRIAGGSEVILSGGIYAPSARLYLTGNSTTVGTGPQMGDLVVAGRVTLAGTASILIGCPTCRPIELPMLPLYD